MNGLRIRSIPVPATTLLAKYSRAGAYTDCYTTDVPGVVSHPEFVEAFYTTRLFKLERWILKLVDKPSTDAEARELAAGRRNAFAAWSAEGRTADQLLMCDYLGRTRSWLMVEHSGPDAAPVTRLYFGSAVVPAIDKPSGQPTLGHYKKLLGFHKLYSRALLSSARGRLAELRSKD